MTKSVEFLDDLMGILSVKNVSITNMPISESKPDQPVLTSVQTSSLQQSSIFTAPTVAPAVHACKTNSITNYFKVASKTTFSPSGNSSLTITKKKQNNNES
jgi:16S rRNA G527 N7-methylase RsmG